MSRSLLTIQMILIVAVRCTRIFIVRISIALV
ncbi:hypothetical protein T11_14207 [Trichinella zimbabwensis]|uniref:Uncharacterized protein n=1 Tax=Trichinella zimbabwensis TaxID=268475 RepID=A0A0V1DMG8_9BILA|nr:hypothetical protein T11_14207 [Trichinella zimbabwensis]